MAAPVVITQANGDTPSVGGLFKGLSFFLVQRLPQRSTFVERIQANGGRVVRLEAQADHVIADHYRRDCPAGSISYTFVETALSTGALPSPDEHSAGPPPGSVRQAGSGVPGRSTRTPFTAEDDKELWRWVERCKAGGALIKGNEIYKQLELKNPRHTYQAWRDRYIKKLMDQPPAGVEVMVAANAPPSPPTAQDEEQGVSAESATQLQDETGAATVDKEKDGAGEDVAEDEEPDFTAEDLDNLLQNADDIEVIDKAVLDDAWAKWSEAFPAHSAQSWRQYWEKEVRPVYLARELKAAQRRKRQAANIDPAQETSEASASTTGQKHDTQSESTKERPGSSESQKRKRASPTARSERTSPRKKQKQNDREGSLAEEERGGVGITATEQPAKPSTQPIELFSGDSNENEDGDEQPEAHATAPTPELNAAAQAQLKRENHSISEDVLPTSELNRGAQAQFDEEVFGLPRTDASVGDVLMSNLPTSAVNRAADQQIRRESLEPRDEVDSEEEESSSSESSSVSNDLPQSQAMSQAAADLLEPNGNALTEANLASQQAEHKEQLLRGQDLPADDEAQDEEQQEKYVEYLQSLTRQSGGAVPRSSEVQQDTSKEIEVDEPGLPTSKISITYAPLAPNAMDDLPMSSQQEIDEAMDDIIQWPSSPTTTQRRVPAALPSQTDQFETQVQYPVLLPKAAEEPVFSSQASFMQQDVTYPSLPEQAGRINGESHGPASSQVEMVEQEESSFVLVDGDEAPKESAEGVEEGLVDLSMPEPEGGWDESSSPARPPSSQPVRETSNPAEQAKAARDEEDEEDIVEVEQHGVIELSSSSPSSSSSSSEESMGQAGPADDIHERHKRALETQDIITAETQLPDFDMPLPPDSDPVSEDELASNPPDQPSSPPAPPARSKTLQSQQALADTQKLDDEDVDNYISTLQTLHKYSENSIIEALKCTSMRPELTELVLLEEKVGKGLPNDVAGIWSMEDDEMLESGDARGIKYQETRHGWDECISRLEFLKGWREADDD